MAVQGRGGPGEAWRQTVSAGFASSGEPLPRTDISVEELVVGECFWESPVSGYVDDMKEVARAGGKAGAPSGSYNSPPVARELPHFDVDYALQGEDLDSEEGYTKVVGTTVWVSEESNGDPRA